MTVMSDTKPKKSLNSTEKPKAERQTMTRKRKLFVWMLSAEPQENKQKLYFSHEYFERIKQ